MTRQDALRLLEETLDLEANTLSGDEGLKDVQGWDSMATLVFIAMVDQQFGVPLAGNQVVRCQTIDDLLGLMGAGYSKRAA